MGCSTFSDDLDTWAKYAEAEKKIVQAAAVVATVQELPELPATLKRCLSQSKQRPHAKQKQKAAAKGDKAAGKRKQAEGGAIVVQPKSSSADALVLKQLEAQKRRQACADQILKWYDGIRKQQAQKVAAK